MDLVEVKVFGQDIEMRRFFEKSTYRSADDVSGMVEEACSVIRFNVGVFNASAKEILAGHTPSLLLYHLPDPQVAFLVKNALSLVYDVRKQLLVLFNANKPPYHGEKPRHLIQRVGNFYPQKSVGRREGDLSR
jgi:hypothetical protein